MTASPHDYPDDVELGEPEVPEPIEACVDCGEQFSIGNPRSADHERAICQLCFEAMPPAACWWDARLDTTLCPQHGDVIGNCPNQSSLGVLDVAWAEARAAVAEAERLDAAWRRSVDARWTP
jgi:hypothetical protein